MGHAGRGGRAQLSEGAAGRCHGIVDRSGTRTHQPGDQTTREGSVLCLYCRAPQGAASSPAWCGRGGRERSDHPISAMESTVSCAPPSCRAIAWRTRLLLKVGEEVEAKFTGVDRKGAASRYRSRRRTSTRNKKPCKIIEPTHRPEPAWEISSKNKSPARTDRKGMGAAALGRRADALNVCLVNPTDR